MTRKSLPIAAAFVLLVLLGASRGEAILECRDCNCSVSCSLSCVTDSGFSTCASTGLCSGSSSCGGGGCLTADDLGPLLKADLQRTTPEGQERGRVAARLTWRLAQHVEESGLGTVYTGETGFQLPGSTGRVQAPVLAVVSGERSIPDLVVELRPAAGLGKTVSSWLAAGTRAVLVLDPAARTVAIHRSRSSVQVLGEADLLEIPDLLPGWGVRVGELFE